MRKHTMKEWLIAVRPWSFPASAMPVVATLGYLFARHDDANWPNGIWALLNIIVFHAAGNTWSDYFDHRRRVDANDTYGARTLTSGMFAPKEILRLSVGLLAAAIVAGVGLWLRTGAPLLCIGLGGLACSVLYPFLKYRAFGDFVIFTAYALLPTVGTVYAATLQLDWSVLCLAVPVGLITVAILHCNNTRDMRTDRRARIRTVAMNIGARASVALYCAEIILPFFWISGCVAVGMLPAWNLIAWAAFFPALKNARKAVCFIKDGSAAIADLDEATAKLQLMFSLSLSASFIVSGIMS